jgi:hypothetical protein
VRSLFVWHKSYPNIVHFFKEGGDKEADMEELEEKEEGRVGGRIQRTVLKKVHYSVYTYLLTLLKYFTSLDTTSKWQNN